MKNAILLLTALFSFFTVYCQTVNLTESKWNEIDSSIQQVMKEHQVPGVSVAIISDGKVWKRKNYGYASLEYKVPISDSTVFWMASISKQMTCSAIMLLVEDGILKLDVPIKTYLPDAPKNWDKVTIRHLMTHTSGLPILENTKAFNNLDASKFYSAEDIYERTKLDTLNFNPGEKFLYSDEGYILLSYLIHKTSGMHFSTFMQERIFNTSKMHASYLDDLSTVHPNQVTGYSKKGKKLGPDRNPYKFLEFEIEGSGSVFATMDDMINWDKTLDTETLLSQNIKDTMWTSYILNNGKKANYGFGWDVLNYKNKKGNTASIIKHRGVAGTQYIKFLDKKVSIIVLTNLGSFNKIIGINIVKSLDLMPFTQADFTTKSGAKIVTPKTSEINKLVGSYKLTGIDGKDWGEFKLTTKDNTYLSYIEEGREIAKLYKLNNDDWFALYPINRYPDLFSYVFINNPERVDLICRIIKNRKPLSVLTLADGEEYSIMTKID